MRYFQLQLEILKGRVKKKIVEFSIKVGVLGKGWDRLHDQTSFLESSVLIVEDDSLILSRT